MLLVLPLTQRAQPSAGAALANLAVVHSWFPDPRVYFSANAPSWSLSCEAAFYASLPLLLPS